ncbi:hypothetical protein ANN_24951 [Periplaneta americana]|uniref:Uncharacterized protein n=1 Tax=Periplaneta americana TaxID=6978 RepID=A0ABQ8S007_PERAM|nr:hypothetical protein ANN_24951 [Periplaneta americana]
MSPCFARGQRGRGKEARNVGGAPHHNLLSRNIELFPSLRTSSVTMEQQPQGSNYGEITPLRRKSSAVIHSRERESIANIIKCCEEEKLNKCLLELLDKEYERAAKYSGKSISSVRRIKNNIELQPNDTLLRERKGILRYHYEEGWIEQEKNSLRHRDSNSGFQLYVLTLYPISHTGFHCENWALNRPNKRKTESAEMKFLRSLTSYTPSDHRRNEDTRNQLQIYNLTEESDRHKTEWLEYIQRMEGHLFLKIQTELPIARTKVY